MYQFKVLCFGLSTAPQVLPGSWLLCQRFYTGWGYDFVATWPTGCFRHSHAPTLQAPRDCCQWGEVSGDSDSADGISGSHPGLTAFGASPALKRVEKFLSIGDVFLSCVSQPVSSGLELLGVLSFMVQLVPGVRLRSSLQACGLRKTSSTRSMPGSSWRSRVLSGGLLHFPPVPQWRSSPTNRQPCRICGTKAGLVLLF